MIGQYTQPDNTVMSSPQYKAAIDASMMLLQRIGGWFAAHQQTVGSPAPELSVRVEAGALYNAPNLTEVAAQTVTGFTIPAAGQERYDRIVINSATGIATRVAGTASTGSPSAGLPAITAGNLPCCRIHITSADSVITDSMITDERVPVVSGGVSAGTIVDFGGTVVPAGFLQCDGSNVSRTTQATLFGAIGTTWGIGDGSTTFTLPDMRRRTAVGSGGSGTGTLGNAVGNTGGEETHLLTTPEIPLHTHGGGAFDSGNAIVVNPGSGAASPTTTGGTGGGGAHNNMPPSAVVLKIIKT